MDILRDEVATYRVPATDPGSTRLREPFKILVSTLLSARTKGEVTIAASKRLFRAAPDAAHLARLSREEIRALIYPVGFYNTKAKYLSQLSRALDAFGGQVPQTIEELITLPGVGRKTASLVMTDAFDRDAICVDTHVHRIMNIWGYVSTRTPLETEIALRKKLPRKHWKEVNLILVGFGQGCCRPAAPRCRECVLTQDCPKIGVTPAKTGPGRNG
ncbi:MAG: endonuclease III [Desulfobacter sp.]